ncbi:hypothetical protein ACFVY4_12035 [Streptomyces sp. NPDC058299]|uniref:hypothetical protein n=1 Tax=Streptomyces sp. NPDC058299 TaxID=3346435 RepID=UPI0036E764A9
MTGLLFGRLLRGGLAADMVAVVDDVDAGQDGLRGEVAQGQVQQQRPGRAVGRVQVRAGGGGE